MKVKEAFKKPQPAQITCSGDELRRWFERAKQNEIVIYRMDVEEKSGTYTLYYHDATRYNLPHHHNPNQHEV